MGRQGGKASFARHPKTKGAIRRRVEVRPGARGERPGARRDSERSEGRDSERSEARRGEERERGRQGGRQGGGVG